MQELSALGKVLVLLGVILAVVGGLLMVGAKIPWLGRLPGDILIQRRHFTFYFPLATSLLLSVLLTLLLWFLSRR